jgi:outer membrane receptor protein involved in Fe transport
MTTQISRTSSQAISLPRRAVRLRASLLMASLAVLDCVSPAWADGSLAADSAAAAGSNGDASEPDSSKFDTIEVLGKRQGPTARADLGKSIETDIASTFKLNQDDIQAQVTASTIDLFRNVPGVYVEDYGNGGIAQGIGMRGWAGNADGIYVASYIDGYQRNTYSSGNSNGYDDLNVLLPETIGSINVIKGPFDVRYGGMLAYGGSIVIKTADFVPTGFAQTFGSFGAAVRSRVMAMTAPITNSTASWRAIMMTATARTRPRTASIGSIRGPC